MPRVVGACSAVTGHDRRYREVRKRHPRGSTEGNSGSPAALMARSRPQGRVPDRWQRHDLPPALRAGHLTRHSRPIECGATLVRRSNACCHGQVTTGNAQATEGRGHSVPDLPERYRCHKLGWVFSRKTPPVYLLSNAL
mgnify:CR=1 FL=1